MTPFAIPKRDYSSKCIILQYLKFLGPYFDSNENNTTETYAANLILI